MIRDKFVIIFTSNYSKRLIILIRLNLPSPIEEIEYDGLSLFLKRDDLIDIEFSGNKARKFYTLLKSPLDNIKQIVSYGSNQSNAMYSLSVLAKIKRVKFIYYTDHIPRYLLDNPIGNYAKALKNGTRFIVGKKPNPDEFGDDTLFIQEGGRDSYSQAGIEILAKEIYEWKIEQNIQNLKIFLPSGTGTTSLYLSKWFRINDNTTTVYTTPCVGDSDYLLEQFSYLERDSSLYPKILNTDKKYHFGKLYREFYEIWLKLQKETRVEFDMLYDPKGWIVISQNRELFAKDTLYIHQGGLLGNESMLPRYERKFKPKG